MRSLTALLLTAVLFLAVPGAARAEDSGAAAIHDPDLAALKAAIEDFRSQLGALREACSQLGRSGDAAAVAECKARYAELREEFKRLREQAIELAHRLREWGERAKEEQEKLAREAERDAQRQKEEAALRAKTLQEKLRWVENRLLEMRVDLELFKQQAREAREQADQLVGEKREDALRIAERWEQKAAQYAEHIRRLEAQRAEIVAKLSAPQVKPPQKEPPKEQQKKERPQPTTSVEKLLAKLHALDEHMAQDRAALARARQEGDEEKVAMLEKGLVQHEKERQELLKQLAAGKDRLRADIKALEEKLAYKRAEQAKHEALAKAYRAAAEQVSGSAREEILSRARKEAAAAREWASLAQKYDAERQRLVGVLELVLR